MLISYYCYLFIIAFRSIKLGDGFGILSFGMTHDYKIAVSMGAGIVRIGTLIFGERNY